MDHKPKAAAKLAAERGNGSGARTGKLAGLSSGNASTTRESSGSVEHASVATDYGALQRAAITALEKLMTSDSTPPGAMVACIRISLELAGSLRGRLSDGATDAADMSAADLDAAISSLISKG